MAEDIDFEKLLKRTEVQFLLQCKNVKGCPSCANVQKETKNTTTTTTTTEIPENNENDEEDEEDEPTTRKKRVCSLEDLGLHIASLWRKQDAKCVSCQEKLTAFVRMDALANFRLRSDDIRKCPSSANVKFLFCVACSNGLHLMMSKTEAFHKLRRVLFFDERRINSVYHLPKLPATSQPRNAEKKDDNKPGSNARLTGMTKAQLRTCWRNQGGLTAFKITPQILSDMDEESRTAIAEEIRVFDAQIQRDITETKTKTKSWLGQKRKSTDSKDESSVKIGAFFTNPHYLVFQVPLSIYKNVIYGFKLFPKINRKLGIACDENSTLVCNLFFGLIGNLKLGEFLSWARRHIKRAPVPVLKTPLGKGIPRFPRPIPHHILYETEKKAQDQKQEQSFEAFAKLQLEKAELDLRIRQKRKELQELAVTLEEPLLAQFNKQQVAEKYFPDLDATMSLGMKAGRRRTVNQEFLQEKLPALLHQAISVPLDRKLTLSEYETMCEEILKEIFSKEFRGSTPPVYTIVVTKKKKRPTRTINL